MKILTQAGLLALVIVLTGCASGPRIPPAGDSFVIPTTNPLYAVKSQMSPADVRQAVGDPKDSNSYMTGKQWIPFYFGSDTSRTEWSYGDDGYVVFTRNRYSGSLKVIRVSLNEPGSE